jgi:hypothetical protein
MTSSKSLIPGKLYRFSEEHDGDILFDRVDYWHGDTNRKIIRAPNMIAMFLEYIPATREVPPQRQQPKPRPLRTPEEYDQWWFLYDDFVGAWLCSGAISNTLSLEGPLLLL